LSLKPPHYFKIKRKMKIYKSSESKTYERKLFFDSFVNHSYLILKITLLIFVLKIFFKE